MAEREQSIDAQSSSQLPGTDTDVLICGAGLAGLTLARQLHREFPSLRLTLLERTRRPLPAAAHKVGESSVELASQYLESLGLASYLQERHIIKFGLRFFPGGGHLPLAERLEIAPDNEPIVRSYQLDRGVLEQDLRDMAVADGLQLIEGAIARHAQLGGGDTAHTITYEHDGETKSIRTRWLVDATGRHALLRKQLKLTRGTRHTAHAGWFRVRGRLDIAQMAPASAHGWGGRPRAEVRWRSTNHLMGAGYWVWLIPLSSGHTSVGVVVHEPHHSFDDVRSIERARAFIDEHEPVLRDVLASADVMDFRCLKGYPHAVARSWSADRWALVGEAGAFTDPLYSPGSDLIAFANTFTTELVRTDLAGGPLDERVRELNQQYRAFVSGGLDVFTDTGIVYGHPRAMATKIYWDNFAYWNFPCQYFQQKLYRLTGLEHAAFSAVGMRFVELSGFVQKLLSVWAELAPEDPQPGFMALPTFPSLLVDAHLALERAMTPAETLAYMREQAVVGEEIAAELVLRIVQELSVERASLLLERAGVSQWGVSFSSPRLALEDQKNLERRHALSSVARDVERNLGPVRRHDQSSAARQLLLRFVGASRSSAPVAG